MLDSTSELEKSQEARLPWLSPKPASTSEGPAARVLLATVGPEPPAECVALAREIVRLGAAELYVLCVKPAGASDPVQNATAEPERGEPNLVSVSSVAVTQLQDTSLAVAVGDFVPTVTRYALELDVGLVIVSGHAHRGQHVAALVRATGRAVLVARRAIGSGFVLAATDLRDPSFPVVRHAGELGRIAQAAVVAVHNVAPTRLELDFDDPRLSRVAADTDATTRQLQALVNVTHAFKVQTAVLTSMLDPVDAILREERERDATLVVVGTRVGDGRTKRSSITVDVVNLAHGSVLVVPLSNEECEPVGPLLTATEPAALEASSG